MCLQKRKDRDFTPLIFVAHKSFLCGHWYPCHGLLAMSALGFKAWMDFLACMLSCLCTTDSSDSPLVWHLLTVWGQHGSQAFLIHAPANMSASIGGCSGFEPMPVHAAHSKHGTVDQSATPARLPHSYYLFIFISLIFFWQKVNLSGRIRPYSVYFFLFSFFTLYKQKLFIVIFISYRVSLIDQSCFFIWLLKLEIFM